MTMKTIWAVLLSMVGTIVSAQTSDTLYLTFTNGNIAAFPMANVTKIDSCNQLSIDVQVGNRSTSFVYPLPTIKKMSYSYPTDTLPHFRTYKFNNKYNDQVFSDVDATISGTQITAVVPCIGHWLTPSFSLSDSLSTVKVNNVLQKSHVNKLNFRDTVSYTLSSGKFLIFNSDSFRLLPYERNYQVAITFPTDTATQIPRIDINTKTGEYVVNKNVYLDATFSIKGNGVFPDMDTTTVQIKGRGNSSWHNTSDGRAKNPFRLKFATKEKPFGLPEGKSWVLLANNQTGSELTNAIGMRVANLMQTAYPNHIVPVDLYFNGVYFGSYNFTEQIGFADNSIDIKGKSSAALLELDEYYDETHKFKTSKYNVPVNIKEPDLDANDTAIKLTQNDIETDFNKFTNRLYSGDSINDLVDVDYAARFMMVNEYILNMELYHPKSCKVYKESYQNESKYIFGPAWDFDWSFDYEQNRSYFNNDATYDYWNSSYMKNGFFYALRNAEPAVDKACYKVWKEFMQNNNLDDLIDYIQDYYNYVKTSLPGSSSSIWLATDNTDYAAQVPTSQQWLRTRANSVYASLTAYPEDTIHGVPADSVESCGEYLWQGQELAQSGDYTDTLLSVAGGDSIIHLHLTVNQPADTAFSDTAYTRYEWNCETYTASGDYEQTFLLANGCDSVVTLHLTLIPIYQLSLASDTVKGNAILLARNHNEVSIQATANKGYHFSCWSDGDTTAQRTLQLTSDTVLVAQFTNNTGIEYITASPTGNKLYNLGERPVSIYSASGILMLKSSASTLTLDSLPKGIYVAVCEGQTFKFIVQ